MSTKKFNFVGFFYEKVRKDMIEKVNPMHPDKIADRIAGALVDMAYEKGKNPKIAVEVLIGHGECNIIAETTVSLDEQEIEKAVHRICGLPVTVRYKEVAQDSHLTKNQEEGLRCGDNGIFKGVPLTAEQKEISILARAIYDKYQADGKYILADDTFICCQSNAYNKELEDYLFYLRGKNSLINPLGEWTGGIDVDSGATNRKLGSDMADSVTGGGLHGKDLSKADVTLNILAFELAQARGHEVGINCAIGAKSIFTSDGDYYTFENAVRNAREYIEARGGFEKFAEWGLF